MWRRVKRLLLCGGHGSNHLILQWIFWVCAVNTFLIVGRATYHSGVGYHGNPRSITDAVTPVKNGGSSEFSAQEFLRDAELDGSYGNDTPVLNQTIYVARPNVTMVTHSPLPVETSPARYQYDCSSIARITIKKKIGFGVSKQVFLGLDGDKEVAVKMVTPDVLDVRKCISDGEHRDDNSKCYSFPNKKLMKEILLLEQLQHPNLMKMLGYCVRGEETESKSLDKHGVVAVHEYGSVFKASSVSGWPFQQQLKTAIELVDLLVYLAHSPLGSLRISDFKAAHFLLTEGRVKLIDMDDVSSVDAKCADGHKRGQSPCKFGLECIDGFCPGHNAKINIQNMNFLVFRELFGGISEGVTKHDGAILSELQKRVDSNSISAEEMKSMLLNLAGAPRV